MAEERGKRYSTGEAIEAIFADEDSNDESFDYGYDLDIMHLTSSECTKIGKKSIQSSHR